MGVVARLLMGMRTVISVVVLMSMIVVMSMAVAAGCACSSGIRSAPVAYGCDKRAALAPHQPETQKCDASKARHFHEIGDRLHVL